MSRFRFEKVINLGHILTAVSMITTIVTFAAMFDRRVTVIELRQNYFDKSVEALGVQNKSLTEGQAAQTKTLERITTILEERSKK